MEYGINITRNDATEDINGFFLCRERFDNTVWEMTDQQEFMPVLRDLIDSAVSDGRKIVYLRFSETPLLKKVPEGLETKDIPLDYRFEVFTDSVYRIIQGQDPLTLFLLDSFSALQEAWNSDLLVECFFRVIVPLIHKKHCMAYFTMLRGAHSFRTVNAIRALSDIMLDIYCDSRHLYLRSQKTGEYTSGTIFMSHVYDEAKKCFRPIQDGILSSKFQKALNFSSAIRRDRVLDSWYRFFEQAKQDYENDHLDSGRCLEMCEKMMSRDPKMQKLILENFSPEDYFQVSEHMIGTGLVGGKACGMLTARRILEKKRPDLYERMEAHNSFYIGTDTFYDYLIRNGLWELLMERKNGDPDYAIADQIAEGLRTGRFSREFEDEICRMLDYYGQTPVIVRSSSLLEDGFGNAFAGKYESVFCPNVGDMGRRLREFEDAIRTVYASAMSRSALDYRERRGLDKFNEQMALLVQKVSGSYYGDYYMPCAAGVGYSYSSYRFLESIDPRAGMLRLVMGLGTAAVDRTEGSYPRLVSMDKPEAVSYKNVSEHHSHSQQNVELIDRTDGTMKRVPQKVLEESLPTYLKKVFLEHDTDAERIFRERGRSREITFISCRGLVQNRQLMQDMKDMLSVLQSEYGQPVDIEFTINLAEDGEYIINLLQCRPLQAFAGDAAGNIIPAEINPEDIVLDCRRSSMGSSRRIDLDGIVYVDPIGYYNLPYHDKAIVARTIGEINQFYKGKQKKLLLMVPGRIGTSSPELGVPTTFADISEFCAIFEMAESGAGYNPELSYGSHMFQDLTENEILYAAVFQDSHTICFRPDRITGLENRICRVIPEPGRIQSSVGLYLADAQQESWKLYHDMSEERIVLSEIRHGDFISGSSGPK